MKKKKLKRLLKKALRPTDEKKEFCEKCYFGVVTKHRTYCTREASELCKDFTQKEN